VLLIKPWAEPQQRIKGSQLRTSEQKSAERCFFNPVIDLGKTASADLWKRRHGKRRFQAAKNWREQMKVSGVFFGSLLAIYSSCLSGQDAVGNAVIAEFGEQKITLGELQQNMADQLFQARQQYYTAEREALDQMVEDRLLAAEARRQGMTVEQLLDRNVDTRVTDPTDDQLRVYHEGLKTDEPFEEMREKILHHIRDLRTARLRTAYVQSLKDQAHVVITFAAPVAHVHTGDAAVRGPQTAPVRLVEFGDYQCPYCRQVHSDVNRLLSEYGAKLSFTFMDLPLSMHEHAQKAAEAAQCAGAQGKYWEFHDAAFEGNDLDVPHLKNHARRLGLDAAQFDKCLDSGEQAAAVAKQAAEGGRFRVSGTPSFFVNGHALAGAAHYDTLREMIDKELVASASEQRPSR
jgi:protein-disulfide isomerase